MAKANRNGKRKPRNTFKKRIPDLGSYIIITDTEKTEKNYLYGLRDSLPKKYKDVLSSKFCKQEQRIW